MPHVDNLWAFAAVLVMQATLMTQHVISYFASRRGHKDISDVKEQVINDHKSNMRDDIDALGDKLDELRVDLRDDRGDLQKLETRIHGFISREHPDTDPL